MSDPLMVAMVSQLDQQMHAVENIYALQVLGLVSSGHVTPRVAQTIRSDWTQLQTYVAFDDQLLQSMMQ